MLPGSPQPPPLPAEKNPWPGSMSSGLAASERRRALFRQPVSVGGQARSPGAEFTEGPGTDEQLTTNCKGPVKSQHVGYEKGPFSVARGVKERKAVWTGFKQPQQGHAQKSRHQTHVPSPAPGQPLPSRQDIALFFFNFIDLNSFYASNTRNRPTFSHLCYVAS